tara:strand:- start:427 stop:945 length:519 start_codon:yes stop_codon:yes gene_type:complete
MLVSLKIFFDILFFSKGPQDLPSSQSLLNLVILANILIGLISLNPDNLALNILPTIVYIVVTSLFIKIALDIKDKDQGYNTSYSKRYLQVCTGILGIHVLIGIITTLFAVLFSTSGDVPIIIATVLILYSLNVNGHIFRNAFDTTILFGLGISLLHIFVCIFFMIMLLQLLI